MDKYNVIMDNTRCDFDMMWQILEVRQEMPHAFFDEIQKLSVYFMFPYSIWSKSKTNRNFLPYENIVSDTNRLEDNGCGLFFEFENVDITPDLFHDRYSNMVLDIAKYKDTYAVVYNSELANYIKENYPDIKLVQSEIKRNIYIDKPYDMGVVDYITYKNNKNILQNKSSYILTLNSFCKNSYRCINILSRNKLDYGIDKPVNCSDKVNSFKEMQKNDLFISKEEIEKINNDGIQNFIIKTNSDDRFEILETYLYYLVKPEFIDLIRLKIIKNCFRVR